jgi:hypothetical protein
MGLLLFYLAGRIVITEVMSNARGPEATCGDRNEYVELYNDDSLSLDLAGCRLSDSDGIPDSLCAWTNDTILMKYPALRIRTMVMKPFSYALVMDREYLKPDTIHWQPYRIPDSTLVITTDDTSIGDGLSSNDPLIVYKSAPACTTAFGTPGLDDGFPDDPGDGVSWERIETAGPDTVANWHPCLDTSGGTPGRSNSASDAHDLSLCSSSVAFHPASVKTGEDVVMEVRVRNAGLRPAQDYHVRIYEDRDRDRIAEPQEQYADLPGTPVPPGDSAVYAPAYVKPASGTHFMAFKVDYPEDIEPADNLVFKEFSVLTSIGPLTLSPPVFSPGADNIDDILQIDYRLPEPGGRLSVLVYDTRGGQVVDICRDRVAIQSRGTLIWNGQADQGPAQTGMYIVYLEYRYRDRKLKAKKTAVLVR